MKLRTPLWMFSVYPLVAEGQLDEAYVGDPISIIPRGVEPGDGTYYVAGVQLRLFDASVDYLLAPLSLEKHP